MVVRLCGRVAVVVLAVACFLLSELSGQLTADSAVLGQAQNPTPTSKNAHRQGPYFLVLVVDAARYDEMNLAQMPNLARLASSGTTFSQAWVGQLPSVTETSHATIGTGVFPARHLVLGDKWRVPGTNQMSPNLLSRQITQTGYIGKFIHGTGSPTLAGFVHQAIKGSRVVAISGHKIYAADAMGAGSADFVAYGATDAKGRYVPFGIPNHVPSNNILGSSQMVLASYPRKPGQEDEWVTTLAEKFLFKYHPQLLMINLPEVDVYGHAVGTDATVMQPLMSNVDHEIGRLLAAYGRAGILEQTYFIVTSDHAMVPGTKSVYSPQIDNIIKKAGGHALSIGHGDSCEIWLQDMAAVPRVAAALANANLANVSAVYFKDEAGRYTLMSPAKVADPSVLQAYADLLSTFDSAESPDIVLMYDENTITMSPFYQKIGRKGDHGGATWGAQHIPLVLYGPGIRQAYQSTFPARLVDIAPTIETLLGIVPQHQDGVPLADAMVDPPAWAVQQQKSVESRLLEDVGALQREATMRPNTTRHS